ncbi:MAG: class I tRNA ligase family protein, partial [Thermodesulfobacteriota bacterium]
CGSDNFVKEEDILDVWFDSGTSHAAVCEVRDELSWPADLYLEGSDQHRGWFQSSLLTSVGTRGRAPFKGVLTHGYVVDGQGKKMSKSIGNVVAPGEVIEKFGAEILRLWVSSEDYRDDVKVSDEILKQVADAYRKMRNTIRYLLGNLHDFDPEKHTVSDDQLPELDRWALARYEEFKEKVLRSYETFEFHTVFHSLHYFCGTTLSAFYLDILKDRLYCSGTDSADRRSAQTVMYEVLDGLLRLMSPILSFTAAESWEHLKGLEQKAPLSQSIFFSEFPEIVSSRRNSELEARWEKLMAVRSELTKALEGARREKIIGHPLEAEVLLKAEGQWQEFIGSEWDTLKEIAIISELTPCDDFPALELDPMQSEEIEGLTVGVRPARGEKCERCWTRSTTVGEQSDHPQLCSRCFTVVNTMV